MKLIKNFKIASILLLVFCYANVVCASESLKEQNSILGDYLFDYKDINAVIFISIYKENSELYAFVEFSNYPVKMELVNAETFEYRIKFKGSGDFNLKFSEKENGVFSRLNFKSNTSEFEINGTRVNQEIEKLREYHKNKNEKYSYKKPLECKGDWEVSTIHEAGFDTVAIYKMMNKVLKKNDYLHSILIVKDGKLVFEEYLNGWDPLRIQRVQSVTKSFTSTLVGIAINEGFINSIDDPIYKYLPEYDSLFDDAKKKILIKHLLTMSAGFEWNEGATYYKDPKKCDSHLADASGDYIKYVLQKPVVIEPGTVYSYNSGFPNILGYIIEKESGMNITKFSYKYLFDPLGIKRSYWMPVIGENRPSCAGGLRLMSRDMARYGELYLNNGEWNGKQVVQKDWIENSIDGIFDTKNGTKYGYFWDNIRSLDNKYLIYFASGTGGQYIACIPELNIVVVTTAKPFTKMGDDVADLLLKKLIPAL